MSGRVVLSWVVVAAVLSGVYLLTGSTGNREGAGVGNQTLLRIPIDPARVDRIEVLEGEDRVVVERAGWSPTGWVLRWREDGLEMAWAAREQRVRGALRALSSARLGARDAGGDERVERAWTLRLSDGSRVRVELLEGGVGGRRGVRVFDGREGEGTAAWAGRDLASALAPEAMMAWRDGVALPRVGSGASAVTIEGRGARVSLARSRGAWYVREPVVARCEPGVVEDVLGRLASLDAGEGGGLWVGASDDAVTGLDEPIAVIELETTRQIPEGDGFRREVTRQRLEVGGTARAAGATRFVRARSDTIVEGSPDPERRLGPVVLAMDVSALSKLTASVEAYVSRTAGEVRAADVGAVRVLLAAGANAGVFRRDRRGGVREGEDRSVGGDDRIAIEALLRLICESPADRVEVLGAESAVDGRVCEVRLESLGGTVLGSYEVGVGDDGRSLTLRDGAVFWIFEGAERERIVAWLRRVLRD